MLDLALVRMCKVCVALRALTVGSFINRHRVLLNFISKEKEYVSALVEIMTSQIMVHFRGNVMGLYTLTPSSYLHFLKVFSAKILLAHQRNPKDSTGNAGRSSLRTQSWVMVGLWHPLC